MATYLELKAQAEKLLEEAEHLRRQEIAVVINDIKAKIAEYGLSAADLGFSNIATPRKASAGRKSEQTASVVRYRGPNGEPWSGMGRQPQWLKNALAEGKNKEDFRV